MRIIPWLETLAAPLRWLERARGWRRPALLGFYALVLGSGGVLLSREAVLWEIPDVPEPFEPASAGRAILPEAENAAPHYRRAAALLVKHPRNFPRWGMTRWSHRSWNWNDANPGVRSLVAANRDALEAWRLGTACAGASWAAAGPEVDHGDLLVLNYLGTLEATRLQAEGDLAGAWVHYLGVVRASIHAGRHGGAGHARVEARTLDSVLPLIRSWADDPANTPAQLGVAGADLGECRAMMPPLGDVVRASYPATLGALGRSSRDRPELRSAADDGGWGRRLAAIRDWLCNEPKRSRKVFRVVTAHHLAHLDRPAHRRPRVASPRYLIFRPDASTPPGLARIKPSTLARWVEASACRAELAELAGLLDSLQAARALFDSLQLNLAERASPPDPAGATARRQPGPDLRPFKAVVQEGPIAEQALAL